MSQPSDHGVDLRPISRGEIFWVADDAERAAAPDAAHPYVVVSDDVFNHSRINHVVVCALTTNPKRAAEPGNVRLEPGEGDLERPSVVVVSQVDSVAKTALGAHIGRLSQTRVDQIVSGLRFQQASAAR